jgi:glycosyltransferase involved in cell wall biosynthesis
VKILFLAFYFPPYNNIGAVRAAALARYWHERGAELKVLSAAPQPYGATLENPLPESLVTRTAWLDVNALPRRVLGARRVEAEGYATESRAVARLGGLYRTLVNFPDGEVGWLPHARRAGRALLAGWRPDFIYATARPFSTLLAASRLARACALPWFAELRDLWTDSHRYPHPAWRRRLERRLEARALASARGLVTVSAPLAERLARFARPVEVAMNGYDEGSQPAPARRDFDGLRIVYTGMVYEDDQDPVPLFQALALTRGKAAVRVEFYGRSGAERLRRLARASGVEDLVVVASPVPHRESLALQRGADVCLLLLWRDPAERGIYTGKLFEYLGARRPVLAVGAGADAAARLVREREAGLVSDAPRDIADWLLARWREKQQSGGVADLAPAACAGLSRREQFERLDRFIAACLAAP